MIITRLYTDEAGDSRFEELDLPLFDRGGIGRISDAVPATGVMLRETAGDYDYDFHNAPERQFIIMLDGVIEIETSTYETRVFRGGDVLFVEDCFGKGHRSRSLDGGLRRSVFVTVGDAPLPSATG